MIHPKTKVYLTIECKEMRNPMQQRSRLDQTLGSNSWMLQENKKPVIHEGGRVTTVSIWGRTFGHRKTEKEINRITENLINRATKYAEIEDYISQLTFETITSDTEDFQLASVLTSDD